MVSGTKKSTAIPSPKQKSISPQTLFIEKQLPSAYIHSRDLLAKSAQKDFRLYILCYAVRELSDSLFLFVFPIRLFSLHKKQLCPLQ